MSSSKIVPLYSSEKNQATGSEANWSREFEIKCFEEKQKEDARREKQGFEDKELKNTEKLDASNKVDFRVLRNWSTMVIKIEEQESELEKKSYYGETKEER